MALKSALDRLYAGFNHAESALDPIQIVRRYPRVEDRELVAFIAAGLAFGRVASVMQSVEAVCAVMGPAPASFMRSFDAKRDGAALASFVHRWIGGTDVVELFQILQRILHSHGSLEAFFVVGRDDVHDDLGPALDSFSTRALALRRKTPSRGGPSHGGVAYFFSRPSRGGACKRLNLFLRWMVRTDGVDPGGWTSVPARQLIVPLDTHTIRVGKCLRLTRRASPGWKMAAEITAGLRALDRDDPVRYDFSLCHLSMMGACGYATKRRDADCPLRGVCKPTSIISRQAAKGAKAR